MDGIENRKTIGRINKSRTCCFEKFNKIDIPIGYESCLFIFCVSDAWTLRLC